MSQELVWINFILILTRRVQPALNYILILSPQLLVFCLLLFTPSAAINLCWPQLEKPHKWIRPLNGINLSMPKMLKFVQKTVKFMISRNKRDENLRRISRLMISATAFAFLFKRLHNFYSSHSFKLPNSFHLPDISHLNLNGHQFHALIWYLFTSKKKSIPKSNKSGQEEDFSCEIYVIHDSYLTQLKVPLINSDSEKERMPAFSEMNGCLLLVMFTSFQKFLANL